MKESLDERKQKTEVSRDNMKITSIGDPQYKDYLTYMPEMGLDFANIRR